MNNKLTFCTAGILNLTINIPNDYNAIDMISKFGFIIFIISTLIFE